jgi:hypothetical protein
MFLKSVCKALIDGMSLALLHVFWKHYADHSMLHKMNSIFQRSRFPLIMAAMIAAKEEVTSISTIARETIGGQAFATSTPAFASQAKCTLNHYAPGGYSSEAGYRSNGNDYQSDGGHSASSHGSLGELGRGDKCFGCQGPHPYIINKVIVCPNKDKPGIKKPTNANCKEWLKCCKKLNKKSRNNPSPTIN